MGQLIQFLLLQFLLVNVIRSLQSSENDRSGRKTVSYPALQEIENMTEDEKFEKALKYTKELFTPNRPYPSSSPTTFAFDPQSPLQSHLPPGVSINPGLEHYNLPTLYNFHQFDPQDVLGPLYQ